MLEDRLAEFMRLHTRVVGISVDSPGALEELRADCGLSFPLLADQDRAAVRSWGLLNTCERGGIAVPSTFVVDENGIVVYRSIDRIEARPEVESLLGFLKSLEQNENERLDNSRRPFLLPGCWDTLAGLPRKLFGRR